MQETTVKNFAIPSALSFLALTALCTLVACTEAPPPPAAEVRPIIQGNQLRFPAGHPQLSLLKSTAAVQATTLSVDLPARLVWNEERTQRIYAPFAGRVTQIRADLGQTVVIGANLVSVSSPEFGVAQADAAKAMTDAKLTDKALIRQKELFDAGIAARKDLETADADAARAHAEADRANARTHLYGGGQQVNQQLTLMSELNGVVVERNVNPGQELRSEQSGPGVPALFVVTDPSQLWVQIDAKEADVGTLKPGSSFDLLVPALPGQAFKGKVLAAADFIDPVTRTIKIRGAIANPQRLLKAEMLGTARIQRQLGQGVVVPASGVFLRGTQHRVFVETAPGTYEVREVVLTYEGAKESVVGSGLAVGEKVVSDNGLLLGREFRMTADLPKKNPMAESEQPAVVK
jgi:cobalt-zinc-cadmium efflux system membrane fusion protein